MISRSIVVVAGVLLLAAGSKSEPGTSTTTSAPASTTPTITAVAANGPANQAGAAPADDDHARHADHVPGMPSGMPMQQHPHDGGKPPNMPQHP